MCSFLTSCKKDIETKVASTPKSSPNMELAKNGDPSIKFSNLNAKVNVEKGILMFNTSDDFTKTIDFLGNATETEIAKWENSLTGFTSVTKNYLTARKAMKETENIDSLQAVYSGKVTIKGDGTIEPILENGKVYGRIVNEKGLYQVGKSIVKYSGGMVISIPDGDEKKLALAMSNLKQDILNGIYIHPIKLGDITPNLNNNALQTRSFCSIGCPTSNYGGYQDFDDDINEQFRLTGNFSILDNSSIVDASGCAGGKAILVNISVNANVTFDKWVKPFGLSWRWRETSSDGGFNWGFGWGIDININGFTGFYYPLQIFSGGVADRQQAGGWSWDVTNSGHVYTNIPLWKGNLPGCTNVYNDMIDKWVTNGITICANRTGLRADALHPNLSLIKFDLYCQQ